MSSLRALVVDDEQPVREELCHLLGEAGGVEIIGQAGDGVDALRLIGDLKPDLVFLDVQMPGLTGFEVARQLLDAGGPLPPIVFVTAFEQYAVDAFKVDAADYLTKPVDPARLELTLEKVRKRLSNDQAGKLLSTTDLQRLIDAVQTRPDRRDQIALRVGERYLLLPAGEISHASMVDDTLVVVTNALSGTASYRTLDELQARLDPAVFWRVHRSHLVNITNIREIVPWFSRNYILKMKDAKATEIPVSRSQTKRLREYLQL